MFISKLFLYHRADIIKTHCHFSPTIPLKCIQCGRQGSSRKKKEGCLWFQRRVIAGSCLLWSRSCNDTLMVTSSHRRGLHRVIRCVMMCIVLSNNSSFIPKILPLFGESHPVQWEHRGKAGLLCSQLLSPIPFTSPPPLTGCCCFECLFEMGGRQSGYVCNYPSWFVMGVLWADFVLCGLCSSHTCGTAHGICGEPHPWGPL